MSSWFQVHTLRLRPISILSIHSRNLLIILAPLLPPKMMSVWRSNSCYYGLNGELSSKDLSRTTKLILYKTLILTVLLYGAEAWTLLSTDAAALRVFEKKVLLKIFGSVRDDDDFRIRSSSEPYELLNDIDKCSVLISSGLVVRMEEYAPAKRVFNAGDLRKRQPFIYWKDQIQEAFSLIGGSQVAEVPGRMCYGS